MKKRGTLPLLILSFEVLVKPSYKNKQRTPTPNMKCHQTEPSRRMLCRRDIHIPKGVYCLLVSDRMKVSSFQVTKTSANKRFLLCLPNRLLGFAVQRYNKKCKCASIASNIFKNDRLMFLLHGF